MQATADSAVIGQWWETRPEANVILATGRVFDVLDVPAVGGAKALARMAAARVETGPVSVLLSAAASNPRTARGAADARAGAPGMRSTDRMHFYVLTRGAPADEDEWWSCGLDASPDLGEGESLRWHTRDSFVLAPPSRCGTGQDARWVREPAGRTLPDGLRLLEYLVDACEEEG